MQMFGKSGDPSRFPAHRPAAPSAASARELLRLGALYRGVCLDGVTERSLQAAVVGTR